MRWRELAGAGLPRRQFGWGPARGLDPRQSACCCQSQAPQQAERGRDGTPRRHQHGTATRGRRPLGLSPTGIVGVQLQRVLEGLYLELQERERQAAGGEGEISPLRPCALGAWRGQNSRLGSGPKAPHGGGGRLRLPPSSCSPFLVVASLIAVPAPRRPGTGATPCPWAYDRKAAAG